MGLLSLYGALIAGAFLLYPRSLAWKKRRTPNANAADGASPLSSLEAAPKEPEKAAIAASTATPNDVRERM